MSDQVEVFDSHEAKVGQLTVRRALPRRQLRTIGAWCFADHMGPAEVTETSGLDIGPHPHTGLKTVTWLVDGAVLHRDSLGSEQVIRPDQLNLMTAGHGVVHAEEATDTYRGTLQGVQLWVAQPEGTRHGPAAFAHHADLPRAEIGVAEVTVLAGTFAGATSPALFDTALVGVDAVINPGHLTWELDPTFEYAVIALEGQVRVGEAIARPGQIAVLGTDRQEIGVEALGRSRLLLLGGVPFPETLVMWWNFVARDRAEISAAVAQWRDGDGRFGEVDSRLLRIPSPVPPWPPGTTAA